jgi:universal stress protein E
MASGEVLVGGRGPKRLLAATDLSSRSDRALRRAALLASQAGAELVLLHVVDDDQPRRLVDAEAREAMALLREQATGLPELAAIRARPVVTEGDRFEAILKTAELERSDLVVLGEHRRRILHDFFLGTTLERVMRFGTRPVLMVNALPTAPYRRVLVATDLSGHAARAVQQAARLGLLDGAEVTLLHAFEPPDAAALAGTPSDILAAQEAEAAREAAAALDGFAARTLPGLAPGRLVRPGRPATLIRDMLASMQADLLVMGTAGDGGLRRAVLGSVAAEVLGAVRCDALAVPPAVPR